MPRRSVHEDDLAVLPLRVVLEQGAELLIPGVIGRVLAVLHHDLLALEDSRADVTAGHPVMRQEQGHALSSCTLRSGWTAPAVTSTRMDNVRPIRELHIRGIP